MQRLMIIGSPGAGKSTLAAEMARRTGLPLIHLDHEYWRPGWVEPPKVEWMEQLRELISRERWIIDGNYGGSLPLRLGRADTLVYLDFTTRICVFRVLKRIIASLGRVRPDMAEACPEHFDLEFLLYAATFRLTRRKRILAMIANFAGSVIRLRNPAEVRRFLASFDPRG